jgi:hypothetical protein
MLDRAPISTRPQVSAIANTRSHQIAQDPRLPSRSVVRGLAGDVASDAAQKAGEKANEALSASTDIALSHWRTGISASTRAGIAPGRRGLHEYPSTTTAKAMLVTAIAAWATRRCGRARDRLRPRSTRGSSGHTLSCCGKDKESAQRSASRRSLCTRCNSAASRCSCFGTVD